MKKEPYRNYFNPLDMKSLKPCYQISPEGWNSYKTNVELSEFHMLYNFRIPVHLRATWELSTEVQPVK
jgi:hypothetical protein